LTPPRIRRGIATSKWPFFQTLKVGFFYEEPDVAKHDALRTAASRAQSRLKRKFKVRKEEVELGGAMVEVVRIYRTK